MMQRIIAIIALVAVAFALPTPQDGVAKSAFTVPNNPYQGMNAQQQIAYWEKHKNDKPKPAPGAAGVRSGWNGALQPPPALQQPPTEAVSIDVADGLQDERDW